jgi:cell division protein FtsW
MASHTEILEPPEAAGTPQNQGADALPHELRREIARVSPYDFPLLSAVILLLGMGAVMVYSATINEMSQLHGDGAQKLRSHLIHMVLGIGVMLVAIFVPYLRVRRFTYHALLLTGVLLALVIFVGVEAGNARRWLAFPGFNFQPAELAKFVFVLYLAHSIAKKGRNILRFSVAFLPHFFVVFLLIALCLFQPDFGTSVLLVVLMFAMLFVAGTRFAYIALLFVVGAFLAFQAIASNDMRLGRFMATLDPWGHRDERGYQMVNSQIAIGSGELTGQGLGFGGQTLTGNLPEGETDFVLSVLAEQLGSLGVLFVAVCFAVILYRGMRIAMRCEEPFGRSLAFGLTLLLVLEAVTNMLVAVALIPTKGLTLPFVSYGGSSMLISCAAIGVLLNISRTIDWNVARETLPIIDQLNARAAENVVMNTVRRFRHQVETNRVSRLFGKLAAKFRRERNQRVEDIVERQLPRSRGEE